MAPSPALMGSASPAVPNTSLLSAAPNQSPEASGAMSDAIGQIRQVAQSIDALGMMNPAFGPGIAQIKTILRQMIVSAAQQATMQTPSSEAVPPPGQ